MNTGKWLLAGLLVLAALPGCSSDDSGNAPEKCDDFLTLFCSSTTSCEVSGGLVDASDEASENTSCKADVSKQVQCSKARRVSSRYNDCMNTLANPPCDDINQAITQGQSIGLPAVCEGVVIVN